VKDDKDKKAAETAQTEFGLEAEYALSLASSQECDKKTSGQLLCIYSSVAN
jgi:hypothetical protein